MSHQVFIERCRDTNPATAQALATAIAQRYGVAPAQILDRLIKGRFQVKANLDLPGARAFMSYLEGEGALCSIVDGAGVVVEQSSQIAATLLGQAAFTPSPVENTAEDPDDEFALMTPVPPADPSEEYGSGSTDLDPEELGALALSSSAVLRLETLDGSTDEEQAAQPSSTTAPVGDVAAFLPPDMLEERKLELDIDEPSPASEGLATAADSSSMTAADSSSGSMAAANSSGSMAADSSSGSMAAADSSGSMAAADSEDESSDLAKEAGPAFHLRLLTILSDRERVRFAVGVGLAILVGFAVVSLIASGREASAQQAVVAELEAGYAAAQTSSAWDALDDMRATALETLELRRRNIVVMSIFLWLILAGIFGFLWMRMIDWSRWESPVLSDSSAPAGH